MPQSGRSIGAAAAKLASVDTLVAARAPPAAYPAMRPACSASIRCDKGPPCPATAPQAAPHIAAQCGPPANPISSAVATRALSISVASRPTC